MNPLDLLAGLVNEDGRTWGAAAAPFQWHDVEAIFSPDGPRWHFLTRPRGGSKSSDLAAVLLAWLATEAQGAARGYIAAADKDQGALLLDAAQGFVARSPALRGVVKVEASKIIAKSGASVEVLAADGPSAYGLRPSFVVVDEIAQWPTTRNARSVWSALVSATAKVKGCRLVCLTSAGDPVHWSHKVLATAKSDPKRWHVAETAGPLPWVDPAVLEAQRPLLRPSEFERLHLNVWCAAEDRLVDPADLAACVFLTGDLPPQSSRTYIVTADLGLKNDRTACVVAHFDPRDGDPDGGTIVVDVLRVWQGSRRDPVQLDDIEAWLAATSTAYGHAPIRLDPWQAVGLAQRLQALGHVVEEYVFSAGSVGRLASSLFVALKSHRLALPNDEDLLAELASVRLRETSPGVVRLDHDSGNHDDRAIALALAVEYLETQSRNFARPVFFDDRPQRLETGYSVPPPPSSTVARSPFVDATLADRDWPAS